ncbi:MAG: carbohydrate porin [Actinobacteria bacterium 13_1_40CM_4_65_12]|nr:MAG: carbohydrate porin [Actinobacteria bacterium 13_1_40CM_4_65_12]
MRIVWLFLLALTLACAAVPVSAQPVPIPNTWGGDLLSRPRLTGDWGGFRDELGKKGVVFDVDLLLTPQGVATGGRDTEAEFWGNAEYTLNVDTGKAGLWPGGFLRAIANSGFGESVLKDSGAISPVNTAALLPKPNEPNTGLMHATFMQFLSPKFGLVAGKFFTLDGNPGEFTGNYRTQFQNGALAFPLTAALVPISAYGGGIVALPWEGVVLSALALDPSGTPTNNDVTEAFRDGVMVLGSAQVAIKPFDLVGHQGVQVMWSNKERFSLNQDPSNLARLVLFEQFPRLADPGPVLRRILERFFPGLLVPVEPLNQKSDTWAVFYSFDQYFWQPKGDPKRGIGIFFTFGTTDGNPNPIKYSYSMGIGGNGVVPGRPNDSIGVGWARTEFSSEFVPFLRQRLDLGLDHEDAVEMYYNAALTGWLNATLDLQVINPGLKKTLSSSGQLTEVNTAVVVGGRLYIRL